MAQKELLEIVKTHLNITWTDAGTDKKIELLIANGISDLDGKSGVENDYLTKGRAQTLLLNYVMYARDGILHEFYINYKKEIVAFINKAKVTRYVKEQTNGNV